MPTTIQNVQIEASWKKALAPVFGQAFMQKLREFLIAEKQKRKIIFPKSKDIFSAFNVTPLSKVKVVILGQDPYHGLNQAHGMCFSVLPNIPIPASLQNIYKELETDLGIQAAAHGYLGTWAQQGVFLLNSVLTVEQGQAGSHQNQGWEEFTDKVMEVLNQQERPIIFVLWGSHAQKKARMIQADQHIILKAPHPSPLSAYRGFFGCGHFSKINDYLKQWGEQPIQWELPGCPQII